MRKAVILVLVGLILSSGAAFGDSVGENFEPGGVSLGGSGYYYNNFDGYWAVSFSPWVDFYAVNNLALGVYVDWYMNNSGDHYIEAGGNLGYSIVFSPNSYQSFVIKPGLITGYYYSIAGGSGNFFLKPYLRAEYFIKPRIAPYVEITGITMYMGSFGFSLSTYIRTGFGIAFYLPTRDKVL